MAAAAAAFSPMEPGFVDADANAFEEPVTALETPCHWDNTETCTACRQVRCSKCHMDDPCDTCRLGAPRTCVAFCDFNEGLCRGLTTINPALWEEVYAAIRCLRDRRDPNLMQLSEAEREQHRQQYFPGFCLQHNTQYDDFLQQYWRPLERRYQVLLNFMIDGSRCALMQYDQFLYEQRDLFQGLTFLQVLQNALLTPVGFMAVDAMYFKTYLESIVEAEQTQRIFGQAEIRQQLLSGTLTEDDVNKLTLHWHTLFQRERHAYGFVAEGLLQPGTVRWLLDSNACLRSLNWNLVFYKLFLAFIYCFVPVDVGNTVPAFHPEWKGVWQGVANGVMAQLPTDEVRAVFAFHWHDFLDNVTTLVWQIDKIMQDVPEPDPRPAMNPSSALPPTDACPLPASA